MQKIIRLKTKNAGSFRGPPSDDNPVSALAKLVDGPGGRHPRIELDLTKCVLVLDDVLLEDREQGFGLLRADVDALKIRDIYLDFTLLL